MIKAMIFGAGQAGSMAARWIPGDTELIAFIDNDEKKQDTLFCGVPVLSADDAVRLGPDLIYISVVAPDAALEIQEQLRHKGFFGRVVHVNRKDRFMDIRLSALRLWAEEINGSGITGDVSELGVYRGEFAKHINALFPDRTLYLFDTFEGFCEKDLITEKEKASDGRNAKASEGDFGDTSAEYVRSVLPFPGNAVFCPGYFPDSIEMYPEVKEKTFVFVSLDTDLYGPTYAGLEFFYPRLAPRGIIMIHDYNSMQYPGVKRAVKDFAEERELRIMPLMDLHGTAVIIK